MLADEGGERRNLGGGKRREISKEMRKGDFFFLYMLPSELDLFQERVSSDMKNEDGVS